MTENEAIEELLYQEDMRGEGIDYQVNNLVIAASVKALMEIQQYRAIGTVEECREARERQRGKKPQKVNESRIRYTDGYICPSCGGSFSGTGIADYCYHCGQALDWPE